MFDPANRFDESPDKAQPVKRILVCVDPNGGVPGFCNSSICIGYFDTTNRMYVVSILLLLHIHTHHVHTADVAYKMNTPLIPVNTVEITHWTLRFPWIKHDSKIFQEAIESFLVGYHLSHEGLDRFFPV